VWWIVLWVASAVAGLLILGALTWRLWKQVRDFGREVAAAGAKIAAVSDELAKVTAPSGRGPIR
jgi:hypothetical protein